MLDQAKDEAYGHLGHLPGRACTALGACVRIAVRGGLVLGIMRAVSVSRPRQTILSLAPYCPSSTERVPTFAKPRFSHSTPGQQLKNAGEAVRYTNAWCYDQGNLY
jgi:hypothetical protein